MLCIHVSVLLLFFFLHCMIVHMYCHYCDVLLLINSNSNSITYWDTQYIPFKDVIHLPPLPHPEIARHAPKQLKIVCEGVTKCSEDNDEPTNNEGDLGKDLAESRQPTLGWENKSIQIEYLRHKGSNHFKTIYW